MHLFGYFHVIFRWQNLKTNTRNRHHQYCQCRVGVEAVFGVGRSRQFRLVGIEAGFGVGRSRPSARVGV